MAVYRCSCCDKEKDIEDGKWRRWDEREKIPVLICNACAAEMKIQNVQYVKSMMSKIAKIFLT